MTQENIIAPQDGPVSDNAAELLTEAVPINSVTEPQAVVGAAATVGVAKKGLEMTGKRLFSNAVAGLLQQLASVEPIAQIPLYQQQVVGKEQSAIANYHAQLMTLPETERSYSSEIANATNDVLAQTGSQLSDTSWEQTAEQIEQVKTEMSKLTAEQKLEWLKSQGVNVPKAGESHDPQAVNETLAPKLKQWVTNPKPVLQDLERFQAESKSAEQGQKNNGLPAMHDALLKLISNVNFALTGARWGTSQDYLDKLIKDNPNALKAHTPESINKLADEFSQHHLQSQKALLIAAMHRYAEEKGHGISFDEAKLQMDKLQPNDIVALLEHGFNHSPKYIQTLDHARRYVGGLVNEPISEKPAIGKSFTERLNAESTPGPAAGQVTGL